MSYENDFIGKEVQNFLPRENRLTEANMPAELFVEFPGVKIHVDYYKC